jgi:hypothetical protein
LSRASYAPPAFDTTSFPRKQSFGAADGVNKKTGGTNLMKWEQGKPCPYILYNKFFRKYCPREPKQEKRGYASKAGDPKASNSRLSC